jgi:hypothetical protein
MNFNAHNCPLTYSIASDDISFTEKPEFFTVKTGLAQLQTTIKTKFTQLLTREF